MSTTDSELLDTLHARFGLRDFRPSQREVIEDVLSGQDVLCVMPTGAGKSLCYQLPAVIKGGLTIVVSPLISLMEDQVRQLSQRKIDAAFLNSSQTTATQREVMAEIERGFDGLLYVAPERFFSGNFTSFIKRHAIAFLAIDEAHCISQWGHDFRPEYSRLGQVREDLGFPPTIALTATATDDVRQDIIRILQMAEPRVYVTGFDRPNLRYESKCLVKKADKDVVLDGLIAGEPGSTIVYCATRKAVDELTSTLSTRFPKRSVFAYHAGMDSAARQSNQALFIDTPGAIAIATNAFGMGINKPDVRLVAHYNTPGTLEAYYQEAGRAGRDGEMSRCVILYHFGDRKTQEFFIDNIGRGAMAEEIDLDAIAEIKARATAKLDLMVRYARSNACRRQQILEYFGDEKDVEDCACDVCRGTNAGDEEPVGEMTEQTVTLILKLLSGIARMNGKFGVGAVAEVLVGTPTERSKRWRLDELSVFGLLRATPAKQIVSMLHRIIESGLARQRDPEGKNYPIVELTPAGVKVMKRLDPPPAMLASLGAKSTARPSRRNPLRPDGSPRDGSPRSPRPSLVGGPDDTFQADAETNARFETLRTVRNELARERKLPSYCICQDKTLMLIAYHQPAELEKLEHIKGMGPHKVRMYGQRFLDALGANATAEPRYIEDDIGPVRYE